MGTVDRGASGQLKPWRLGIAPEQDSDVPYLLYQFTAQRVANMIYQSGPGPAIGSVHPDLDQLVVLKCLIDGTEHRRRQAVGTDDKHRFPGMSQSLKMAFLRIVEHRYRKQPLL